MLIHAGANRRLVNPDELAHQSSSLWASRPTALEMQLLKHARVLSFDGARALFQRLTRVLVDDL